jgi:sulfatase modifying factor 1
MTRGRIAITAMLACTTTLGAWTCPEDLSGDGTVDLTDLGVLLAYYGWDDGGDIDDDGDTDLADLGRLLALFGADCPDPEDMAPVPGGEFAMGDHYGVGWDRERPVHNVYVDSFLMGIHEVTNEEYAAFLNAAYPTELMLIDGVIYGVDDDSNQFPYCGTRSYNSNSYIIWDGESFTIEPEKEDHPMIVVSWFGAAAYANWRSEQEQRVPSYDTRTWECDFDADGYRLPTEAEWEYAARGGLQDPYVKYPWGNEINGSHANYYDSGDPYEDTWPETTPVGYYDGNQIPAGVDMANGYGVYDLIGNVWEWCNDWFDEEYYSYSPYDNPRGASSGTRRVLRGGSWNNSHGEPDQFRCAWRDAGGPNDRNRAYGFRLALNAPDG